MINLKSIQPYPERFLRTEHFLLAVIVAVSVVIKILFVTANPVINVDGVLYVAAAKRIAAGEFHAALEIYSMPFYPFLIALIHNLVNDWEQAGRLISLVSMVFAIFPLYLITRELINQRAALWSCLVFALVPLPNEWAIDVIRDPAFLFCFAWAIYFCILVITRKRVIYCYPAAVFAWAAFMFRIEGIVLFPIVFLIFTVFLIRNPIDWKFWLRGIAAWFIPSLLVGGVLIGIALLNDTVSLNRLNEVSRELKDITRFDFLDNYHKLYAGLKKLEGTPPFSFGNQNIITITRHYMAVIYMFGILEFMIRVLFPVFVIPIVFGFNHRWEKKHWFVMVVILTFLFMFYYSMIKRDFLEIRFVFIPVFLMYLWVGNGLDILWGKIRKMAFPRVLFFLFIVSFIFIPLYKTVNSICSQDEVLREAGQWLASAPEFEDARIAVTDVRISFYADKADSKVLNLSLKRFRNNYELLEKAALNDKSGLIAEKVRNGEKPFKGFDHYRIAKTFKGKINWVHFYQFVGE